MAHYTVYYYIKYNIKKTDLFNQYFSSMYTEEDLCNVPDLEANEGDNKISSIDFTEEDVTALLRKWYQINHRVRTIFTQKYSKNVQINYLDLSPFCFTSL